MVGIHVHTIAADYNFSEETVRYRLKNKVLKIAREKGIIISERFRWIVPENLKVKEEKVLYKEQYNKK